MADKTPPNGKKIIATGSWTRGGVPRQNSIPEPKITVTPPPFPRNPPPPSLMSKMRSAVDAYVSRGVMQDKKCPAEVKKIRSISCHGDESLGIPPCPFRKPSALQDGRFYCGECGCGDRHATWLNSDDPEEYIKLDFPKLVCPLNMPGFSNYTPLAEETEERKSQYDFSRKEQIEKKVDLTIKATDEKN